MSADLPFDSLVSFLGTSITLVDSSGEEVTLPIVYSNELRPVLTEISPWLLVEMTDDTLSAMEIGAGDSNTWRESGQILIYCFIPSYTGSRLARLFLKQISNKFRVAGVAGNVIFRSQSIGMGGLDSENGAYWVLPMSINWVFDDHRSS